MRGVMIGRVSGDPLNDLVTFWLSTVRLLVPGHFYLYAVSKFLLRENDISVLLL